MVSGHRYRLASVCGTVVATVGAVAVANLPVVQSTLTTAVPVARRLPGIVLANEALTFALATTIAVVVASFLPLFKPRPRRIVDVTLLAQKRVVVAGLTLAAVGYFDYTYRLPRTTLAVVVAVLLAVLPAWFVAIRGRPAGEGRAVVVGDDPEEIHDVLESIEIPVVGYVSPPSRYYSEDDAAVGERAVADGSGTPQLDELEYLGGLSRIEEVFVEHDIDTAVLAFERADRAEFFGALHECYEHGVRALASRKHAETVLTPVDTTESLVEIDLEPWDWQDRLFKRAFDVAFASVALLAMSPIVLAIVLAIKVEGQGPILFSQERTYRLGDTFRIYKFRTLTPDDGEVSLDIEGDRRTPLGEFLRRTHLDEIPQLWSILVGDMSVVGPRPAITELEPDYESEVNVWRQRWFVKPGLTGLAQINGATGKEPDRKIEYDIEYVRQQSLWFDLKIVVRQVWQVFLDLVEVGASRTDDR